MWTRSLLPRVVPVVGGDADDWPLLRDNSPHSSYRGSPSDGPRGRWRPCAHRRGCDRRSCGRSGKAGHDDPRRAVPSITTSLLLTKHSSRGASGRDSRQQANSKQGDPPQSASRRRRLVDFPMLRTPYAKEAERAFPVAAAPLHSWQTLQALTLLFSERNVDLLPQLKEQIHLISRFLDALVASDKPFSTNFGMTHDIPGQMRSMIVAIPCPTPMHIVARP